MYLGLSPSPLSLGALEWACSLPSCRPAGGPHPTPLKPPQGTAQGGPFLLLGFSHIHSWQHCHPRTLRLSSLDFRIQVLIPACPEPSGTEPSPFPSRWAHSLAGGWVSSAQAQLRGHRPSVSTTGGRERPGTGSKLSGGRSHPWPGKGAYLVQLPLAGITLPRG